MDTILFSRNTGGQGLEFDEPYINKRKEEMKVGVFFDEILDKLNVDVYDTYQEAGKLIISLMKNGIMDEISSGNKGLSIALTGTRWMENQPNISLENLEATYNKLYGDRKDLKVPDEENGNTYKITLPDGKEEEINGKDLYKAKFRYVTTKNGEVNIEITKNEETPQKITYNKVNNINNCIVREDEYTYTYNCLPYLDCGSVYGTFDIIEFLMSEDIDYEVIEIIEIIEERILKYRFNLDGWNVTQSNLVQKLIDAGKISDPQWLELGGLGEIKETCKSEINGEPVTCMVGTYLGRSLKNENIEKLIPNTVKYMFDTFRETSFSEDIEEITIPKSVEYGGFVVRSPVKNRVHIYSLKIKLYENSKGGCLGFCDGRDLDELISEGFIEIYK